MFIDDEGTTSFRDYRLLVVTEETLESDLERFGEEGGFDGVSCPGVLLPHFPDVRFADVTIRNDADRSTFQRQTHLTRISVSGPDDRAVPIDLSGFEGLVDLSLYWHPTTLLPREMAHLEYLFIRHYSPTTPASSLPSELPSLRRLEFDSGSTKSMPPLPLAPRLEHLEYDHGRVPMLTGLDRVPNVRFLRLEAQSQLTDISAVGSLHHLEEVWFDGCRRLTDFSPLGQCPNLRILRIVGSPNVDSVGFLRSCPGMELFSIRRTMVLDGDLTPLIGIERVAFEEKRHYTHTQAGLRELTARLRRGEPVEPKPPAPAPTPAPRPATGGPPPLPTADWLQDLPEGFPRKGVQALNVRLERFVEDMAPLRKDAPVSHVLYRVKWVVKDIGLINEHYDDFLDTGAREELVDFIHDMVADYEVGTWGDDLTERWRRW